MQKQDIINLLDLEPLPGEGGFYKQTFRSSTIVPPGLLGDGYKSPRALGTAIYYLIDRDNFSALHRLRSPEVWHFYLGDVVEMLQLNPDGTGNILRMGPCLEQGIRPQVVVRENTWQGTHLVHGGKFALLGTTMSPAFDEEEFELGDRSKLCKIYPTFTNQINTLTRT